MASVKVIQVAPPPPPHNEYVVTLTYGEAESLHYLLRNVGGVGPRRKHTDSIERALELAGLPDHERGVDLLKTEGENSLYWRG